METKFYDQEKTWPDSISGITAKFLETSKIKNETKMEIQHYSQETNSSSSCVSHLIDSETPLGLSMVVGQCSIEEHHEENPLDEILMDVLDYKKDNKPSQPLYTLHSDKKACRAHGTHLLKLELKAIACSNFKHLSHRTNPKFQFGETEDLEVSSSEDDDVFTELSMSEAVLENQHKIYVSQAKQGHISNTDVFPIMADNNHEVKKWNEQKTSLEVRCFHVIKGGKLM